jgi:hypothetical protein
VDECAGNLFNADEGRAMSDAHDDLRATAEALQDDSDLLEALELEKETLDPHDPRMADVTRRVEALIRQMATKATAERELVDEIQAATAE